MSPEIVPTELIERLANSERLLLSSHLSPDGDAIGSELGLARALRATGKQVVIWNRDPTPRLFAPLAGSDQIHIGDQCPAGFPASFDAAVLLECPSPDRCGLDRLEELPRINIDHHLGNTDYGVINWVDTHAAAVAVMVFALLRALEAPIDRHTADALYLALVSDTGGFRFSNSRPRAFRAAADMVAAGASPERVATLLYERQSQAALRLLAESLQSLELSADGQLATLALTLDMFARAGARQDDSEGLIDYPRSIEGVRAVALFRQVQEDRFKVSLRSRGAVDVEAVARSLGGGGHRNAAGCLCEGAFEEIRADLVERLIVAIRLAGPETPAIRTDDDLPSGSQHD